MRIFYLQCQSIIDSANVILPTPPTPTKKKKAAQFQADAISVPAIFDPGSSGVESPDVLSADPSSLFRWTGNDSTSSHTREQNTHRVF